MEGIGRQTIIFFLPNSMEAFTDRQSLNALDSEGVGWYKMQLYMNPQTFNIKDKKFIKSDLTKGGFVTQYWGEDLTQIDINGTTGSAGIEGINVLRAIYRHEQGQYRELLERRRNRLAEEAAFASSREASLLASYDGNVGTDVLNLVTGGGYSQTVDGLNNAIDIIAEAYNQENPSVPRRTFRSIPTLAALATNVNMYYQGEFFRGYFSYFNVNESANEPGHFSYSTNFVVTQRTGRRNNFMPWHRNPLDSNGVTQISKGVTEAKGDPLSGGDNFTFPIGDYPQGVEPIEITATLNEAADLEPETIYLQNRPGQG